MGYSRLRTGRDGKPRYTAYYWDIRGRERSAGTFSKQEGRGSRLAEGGSQGRRGPRRGSQARPADLPPVRDRRVAAQP